MLLELVDLLREQNVVHDDSQVLLQVVGLTHFRLHGQLVQTEESRLQLLQNCGPQPFAGLHDVQTGGRRVDNVSLRLLDGELGPVLLLAVADSPEYLIVKVKKSHSQFRISLEVLDDLEKDEGELLEAREHEHEIEESDQLLDDLFLL